MSLAEQFAAQDNSVGREMPRYRCHKEVWALKIESVESQIDGSLLIAVDGGVMSIDPRFVPKRDNATPKAGWYLVVYKDGYQSFSPAEAFEEGYTRI